MQCNIILLRPYIFDRYNHLQISSLQNLSVCSLKYLSYFQARSIQELAKKNFENLRQDSDDNEPEPKVVRRGRPPTKKKPLGRPPLERARSEVSSDATLANAVENSNWVSPDFRKRSPAAADSSARFYGSRNEFHAGWLAENRFERNDGGTYLISRSFK